MNNCSENLTNQELQCLQTLKKLIEDCGDELVLQERKKFADELLLIFIRVRKYNADSAFQKFRALIHMKIEKYPEVFEDVYPSRLQYVFENGGGAVLKNRDEKGRHVAYLRASFWDPDRIPLDDLIGANGILGFEILHFKETQVKGGVLIVDLKGFNFKQARQATPALILKYATIFCEAVPFKVKGVHLVNAPMIFNVTHSLIRMFLPEKLRRRTFVHGSSWESLHRSVSPSILPNCLGGKLSEVDAIDYSIFDNLKKKGRDEYYKKLLN